MSLWWKRPLGAFLGWIWGHSDIGGAKKVVGGVGGGDNVSFVSLASFRALKLSIIDFFLGSLSLKGVDLGVGVFLGSLSLNREKGVEVTCLPLFRVLKRRFLGCLSGLLVGSSIGFFAGYFAGCLVSALFLLAGRYFLDLGVILIVYYREE